MVYRTEQRDASKGVGYLFVAYVLLVIQPNGVSADQTAQTAPSPPIVAAESDPRARLVVGSEDLQGRIRLGEPRFRSLGQFTQAQVLVQNLSHTRFTLEYKFDWEDEQGFQASTLNTWHRFVLAAGEEQTFTSTGQVPEATRIVFTVRLPDDYFIESERQAPVEGQPYVEEAEHRKR